MASSRSQRHAARTHLLIDDRDRPQLARRSGRRGRQADRPQRASHARCRLLEQLQRRQPHRRADSRPHPARRRRRQLALRWPAETFVAVPSACACSAWRRRPGESPTVISRPASPSTPRTSSVSWPARWTPCNASWRSSTARASASRQRRRTSCARRSSHSAASWNWIQDEDLDEESTHAVRRAGTRAGRAGRTSSRPGCWTSSRLEGGGLDLRLEPRRRR